MTDIGIAVAAPSSAATWNRRSHDRRADRAGAGGRECAARAARGLPGRLPAQPRRRRRDRGARQRDSAACRPHSTSTAPRSRRVVDWPATWWSRSASARPTAADRYNAAVCVHGDGVLGSYRKVHQPLRREPLLLAPATASGPSTPRSAGSGMLICYDKAFPEAARALALDGAEIIVCMSAWPAARTDRRRRTSPTTGGPSASTSSTSARALENQVVWVASNQAGTFGSLRFVGSAKVVGPGGDILATTGVGAGPGGRRRSTSPRPFRRDARRHVPPARPPPRRVRHRYAADASARRRRPRRTEPAHA